MQVLETKQVVMCDIDFTLLSPDPHKYPHLPVLNVKRTMFKQTGEPITGMHPHAVCKENIEVVKNLHAKGFTIVAWSQAGWDWAKSAIEALELTPYITLVMNKPQAYIDDKDCTEWMGTRIWNPFI